MSALYNTHDFRAAAQRRLPRGLFEFVDRGTENELACARTGRLRLKFVRQVLVDVSKRDARVTLFGREWTFPVAAAPSAPSLQRDAR